MSPAAAGEAAPECRRSRERAGDKPPRYGRESPADFRPSVLVGAKSYPWLGRFVARLEIPETGATRWEKTTTSRGDHTLWGGPPDILVCIVSVELAAQVE